MSPAVRPYAAADAARVVAFLAAVARADPDIHAPSLEEWRVFTGQSFNRGAADFAVAEEGEGLAALLTSTLLGEGGTTLRHFRIVVHPDHRRRGLGSRLLRFVEGQDAAGSVTLQAECLRSWIAGTRFLERHGFRPRLDVLWMVSGEAPEGGAAPPGIGIRPYRENPADDAAWTRLSDEAYRGGPDFVPLTPPDLALLRVGPGFRLAFAESGGEPVGLCHLKEYSGRLYVNSLVVTPAHRRRGIGRALLLEALAHLRDRGADTVRLTVLADNAPAVALYESAGFTVEDVSSKWRRGP